MLSVRQEIALTVIALTAMFAPVTVLVIEHVA